MKQIQLSQGMVAAVDDDDFERLSGFRWFYRGERNENLGYAMRHGRKTDRTKSIYLHREIANPPPGNEVVFVNHDRLDCAGNRICSWSPRRRPSSCHRTPDRKHDWRGGRSSKRRNRDLERVHIPFRTVLPRRHVSLQGAGGALLPEGPGK